MKNENIIWVTLPNSDGEGALKQHAFMPTENGKNRAICRPSGWGISHDGDITSRWADVTHYHEGYVSDDCCKNCRKIANV